MNRIKERIRAVMIGHAIGDALGVPVEFSTREALIQNPVTDMEGYGTYPVPAGAWSDDTSMAVAALDCLSSGEINWDDIMSAFVKWRYNSEYTPTGRLFDIGSICSLSIDNYYVKHMSATQCGLGSEYSNGNGSLMRIHPFALMTWYYPKMKADFDEIIADASSLTHSHERSILGCQIYTLILHHLLQTQDKDSIKIALQTAKNRYSEHSEHECYARLWDSDFESLPSYEIMSSGYVVDTLEAAVWCVLTTASYQECVLKAVNLGEDTDTVGAVAGGLAGALYGYDSIPKEWKDTLIQREYIEEMCDRASEAWSNS